MAITFDQKIKELEQKKSELDLSFLQSKRQWYIEKIYEIIDNTTDKADEIQAITTLNAIKICRIKMKELEQKIKNYPKAIEEIDKKILFFQDRRKKIKDIRLYRDTAEWISETFWWDTVYQYAVETNNKELLNKIKKRCLTVEEYTKIIEKDYPKYLKTKHEEYTKEMEKMYSELFWPILKKESREQENAKTTIILPEWMSEQIKEELKTNKDIRPQDIEKLLKNELKKNAWEIMLSHIKNKFNDKYIHAYEYIRRLIINYPWFKIIDNQEKKASIQIIPKNSKLIKEAIESWSLWKQEMDKEKEDMMEILNETLKVEDVEKRCKKYVDLFEKVWCKFSNKEDFISQLVNSINTQTHTQFDNWIQNILSGMIQTNLKPEKSRWQWYLSYKLSPSCDARRIIAYPNWEIFTIRPHDEYEEIISKKPPVDKRRK